METKATIIRKYAEATPETKVDIICKYYPETKLLFVQIWKVQSESVIFQEIS